MITKFTFPNEGRISLQSVGKDSNNSFNTIPQYMAEKMLFWGDLYTIIYNFLGQNIDNYEDAKAYFEDSIDFKCYIEYTKNKINIANSFYFYFDK